MRSWSSWFLLATAFAVSIRCGGGGGGSSANAPSFVYPSSLLLARVGEPVATIAPSIAGLAAPVFSVSPSLPTGLTFDTQNGSIAGTPQAQATLQSYLISAQSNGVQLSFSISLVVGPQLPTEFLSLEPGYAASIFAANLPTPVRMALAPDGRIFFHELSSGAIRILDSAGQLLAQPFATISVLSGGHKGLLGLALDPNFAANGFVYFTACIPAGSGKPDRVQLLRLTDSGNAGTNLTVLVDNLPIGQINNGGEIIFDAGGNLFLSLGDVEDPALAQDPNSKAGKVHRFTKAGGIPAGNPFAGNSEWCRGLRNTFGLALNSLGDLFGAENGPATNDELNFLQAGKNYEWGLSGAGSGFEIGHKITGWVDVIAPTAIHIHSGIGAWASYRDRLFLTSYVDEAIHVLHLSGTNLADFESESLFARFQTNQFANKPLHLIELPDGSLLVSTFSAIYKIWKFGP